MAKARFGADLYVDGEVELEDDLLVGGDGFIDGDLEVTGQGKFLADLVAPFVVVSSVLVTNLNADLLDGQHGAYYRDLANATGVLAPTKGGTGLNALGTSGQIIRVNSGGSALEYFTPNYLGADLLGVANGIATLDAGGKIPISQLPSTGMQYMGTWDASTNTPPLSDGTGSEGQFYRVTTGGTVNLGSGNITFTAGDDVIHNGASWQRAPSASNASNLGIGTRTATDLPITNSNGTGVTLPVATNTLAGLMSAADKVLLGDLQTASHPAASLSGTGYLSLNPTTQVFTASPINLASHVTGVLPIASGGTGLSTLGTALQVLRVNAGATGLEYATLTIPTVNNGMLNLATGAGLTGSAVFTANQSGSSTFTVGLDANLSNLNAVTGTGFLKRTGTNTWAIDTTTYLTGTGMAGYIPKWGASTSLNDSAIYQDGSGRIGIGTTSMDVRLVVDGGLAVYGNSAIRPDSGGNGVFNVWRDIVVGDTVNDVHGTIFVHDGVGSPVKNANAAFEIKSTTKGILFPRMTATQRDAIAGPAGMVVYNTTTNVLSMHNGSAWVNLGTGNGSVSSISAGAGMDFTSITTSGSVALGTPSAITLASANSVSGTTHTHAFQPGGMSSQYIRGDGSLATFPSIPTVGDGVLTLAVGTGLTGSATFTANQAGNSTFTVGLGTNLTNLNALNTTGFVKKTGANTWSIDANTYLPTTGGTMSGNINMNSSGLAIRFGGGTGGTGGYIWGSNNNSIFGYGVFITHNAERSGDDYIQPRGALPSKIFTVNHSTGFEFLNAAASGTNGSVITPERIARITSAGNLILAGSLTVGNIAESSWDSILAVTSGGLVMKTTAANIVTSGGGVPSTRLISSGTGLTGGGDLSADRTLSVVFGTTAGTVAQGNDARILNGQTAYEWGNYRQYGLGSFIYSNGWGYTDLDELAAGDARATSFIGTNLSNPTGNKTGFTYPFGIHINVSSGIRGDLIISHGANRMAFRSAGRPFTEVVTEDNIVSIGSGLFVNTTGNQTGIAGNKQWTGRQQWILSASVSPVEEANSIQMARASSGVYFIGYATDASQAFTLRAGAISGIQLDLLKGGVSTPSHGTSANWYQAYQWGNHASAGYVPQSRTLQFFAGSGLSVSGTDSTNLSVNRNVTYSVNFGTSAGTVAQGNDSRINNGQTAYGWGNHASAGYVPQSRTLQFTAGSGLSVSGTDSTNLSVNRTVNYSINFGTGSGQVAQGNDSRINNGQTAYSWGNHASAGYVTTSREINTTHSIQGGGNLGSNRTLSLVNDSGSPGGNKYYGTNSAGVKGFYDLPSGGGGTLTGGGSSGYISKWSGGTSLDNSTIYQDGSGNIGIGTTSTEGNKLYVWGNFRVSSGIYASQNIQTGSHFMGSWAILSGSLDVSGSDSRIGGGTSEVCAVLTLNSTSRGLLLPRMTYAQRIAITSPQNGLMVYQTNDVSGANAGFWGYEKGTWRRFHMVTP